MIKNPLLILMLFQVLSTWSQELPPNADSIITSETFLFHSATDSTITGKSISVFDVDGNKISSIEYSWNDNTNAWSTVKEEHNILENDVSSSTVVNYEFDSETGDWIYYNKYITVKDTDGNWLLDSYYYWDKNSNSWVGSSKHVYDYDSNSNQILSAIYSWDHNHQGWKGILKFEYTYDTNGNRTAYMMSDWDSDTFDWKGFKRYDYHYDELGNKIKTINYQWHVDMYAWKLFSLVLHTFSTEYEHISDSVFFMDPENDQWVLSDKTQYQYDENGNKTTALTLKWNKSKKIWENKDLHEFTYDEQRNMMTEIYKTWDIESETWMNVEKLERAHDANGNIIVKATYSWSTNGNTWIGSYKEVFAYDEFGNKILDSTYPTWNTKTNDWSGFRKSEWEYDENGNNTLYTIYDWDSNTDDWIEITMNSTTYDENGNKLLYIKYRWNKSDNTWIGSQKEEYVYDENGKRTTYALYLNFSSSSENWIGRQKEIYSYNADRIIASDHYTWNDNLNDWEFSERTFYRYSNGTYLNTDVITLCEGDSVMWRNEYYSFHGTYADTFQSILAKDSIYQLTLKVLPNPMPFSIAGNDSVLVGQTGTYTVPKNNDLSYTWIINSGEIVSSPENNAVEIHWTKMGEGSLYSYAIDTNQCMSDTAVLTVIIGTSGFSDTFIDNKIIIYPNPAREVIHILTPVDCRTEIFSSEGSKLLSTFKKSIDVSGFDKGVYILRFYDAEGKVLGASKCVVE